MNFNINKMKETGSHALIAGNHNTGRTSIAKQMINEILTKTKDNVIIIDYFGEYSNVVNKNNGTEIKITDNHISINPLELLMLINKKDENIFDAYCVLQDFFIMLYRNYYTTDENKEDLIKISNAVYNIVCSKNPSLINAIEKLQENGMNDLADSIKKLMSNNILGEKTNFNGVESLDDLKSKCISLNLKNVPMYLQNIFVYYIYIYMYSNALTGLKKTWLFIEDINRGDVMGICEKLWVRARCYNYFLVGITDSFAYLNRICMNTCSYIICSSFTDPILKRLGINNPPALQKGEYLQIIGEKAKKIKFNIPTHKYII